MTDPWLKFYPTDWRSDPKLRMCGLPARGLWIELIAIMHEATPYGHLLVSGLAPTDTQLAVLVGAPSDQIPGLVGELEAAGVFSRTREGVIYSRRMTRVAKKSAIARKNGKNGGNPTLRKQTGNSSLDNQIATDQVKPQKPEARSQIAASQHRAPSDLVDRLLEAAGVKGNPPQGLAFPGEILGLIQAGFDLETDILPAIRARPKPTARTWGYFVPQIREAVERRNGAAAVPKPEAQQVDWAGRLRAYYETGVWGRWGPKPGDPGCEAPPELIRTAA